MAVRLARELLGLAGEYAVAAELCRRRAYCQLTLGHHKRTDLLLESEEAMLRIQVKAKQSREWPGVTGLYRSDEFLVLVDFAGKTGGQRPDFYVGNRRDWKALVSAEKRRYPEVTVDRRNRITYADGYQGLNIRPEHVATWKDKWDKILSRAK